MYGHQIERAILSDPVTRRTFHGVETRDHVKIPRQRPSVIIANTDDSSGPGKHWVVFFFPKRENLNFSIHWENHPRIMDSM